MEDLKPKDVSYASAKKVWWQCTVDPSHVWKSRVFSRTKNGSKCPICCGKKASKTTSLAATNPELIEEWHPILNGDMTPHTVVAGSGKTAWWKCAKCSREWHTIIRHRVSGSTDGMGTGCPYCAGQKASDANSVEKNRPDLLSLWDYSKNIILPSEVSVQSHKKVWWKCPKAADHVWESEIYQTEGCPCCLGRIVVPSNCLETTYPNIAAEWHPSFNSFSPKDIASASNKHAWFICSKNKDHVWKARIAARTWSNQGCPICSYSKGEQKIKEILQNKNIEFISQYKFPDCVNKRPLPFDFVLFIKNRPIAAIEFQGRQHFESVQYFGGELALKDTKNRDSIKNRYCKNKNIPLLEISHFQYGSIESVLNSFLNKILLTL